MFETDLKNLASLIVAQAIKSDTSLSDRVDAFKAATAFYGLLLKNKELDNPEVNQGPSFLDFSEAVAEKGRPNGGAKVRTGARRRGSSGLQHSSGDI